MISSIAKHLVDAHNWDDNEATMIAKELAPVLERCFSGVVLYSRA